MDDEWIECGTCVGTGFMWVGDDGGYHDDCEDCDSHGGHYADTDGEDWS